MFTRGMVRQAHTEACRRRFEKDMADDERVKASVEREKDFVAREVERDVQARRNKEGQAEADRKSREKRDGDGENPKHEPMKKRCKEQHVYLKDKELEWQKGGSEGQASTCSSSSREQKTREGEDMEGQDVQQQKRIKVTEHDDAKSIWDTISNVNMSVNDEEEEELWRLWMINFMDAWGQWRMMTLADRNWMLRM